MEPEEYIERDCFWFSPEWGLDHPDMPIVNAGEVAK